MNLKRNFYQQDTLTVAQELLGKILIHETAHGVASGIIVETEAYMGPEDKASHSFGNLRTKRTETMYGPKGHAYIYLVYGMYHCLNVTSGQEGKPEAVLIRALEPVLGVELMLKRRGETCGQTNLTSGPGKLCIALGLSTRQNGVDLQFPPLYIKEYLRVEQSEIASAKRIGVDYAEEWKGKPWRFFIKSNNYVSRPTAK